MYATSSVVLVGYVGLHESDILNDDLMVPPAESITPAPTAPTDEEPDIDQVGDGVASRSEFKSPALPDAAPTSVVEATDQPEAIGEDVALELDDIKARQQPEPPVIVLQDEMVSVTEIPTEAELSEPGEKTESAATEPAEPVETSEEADTSEPTETKES